MEEKKERKPNGWWTKERCAEEALRFTTIFEFRNNSSAYDAACKKGFLNDIGQHLIAANNPNGYWTKVECAKEAQKYRNRNAFNKGSKSGYLKAYNSGWLDEICSHMTRQGNYQKRNIYRAIFPDKSIYIGLTSNFSKRKYNHLTKAKSSVNKHIVLTNTQPIIELINDILYDKEDAAELEDFMIEEYKKYGYVVLNKTKGGGLGNCKLLWSYTKIKEEALKYTSREAFKKGNPKAFSAANNRNILKEVCSHMPKIKKENGYWTYDKVKIESEIYSNRKDFKKYSGSAYTTAVKNKWLDELMPVK